MYPPREFLVALALLGAPFFMGCPFYTSVGTSSWGSSIMTAGDPADHSIVRLEHNGRPYLIMAVDITGGGSSGGGAGDRTGGFISGSSGREVEWSCATDDGVAGQVAVDGQAFDLENGGLFLVTTKTTPANVVQISARLEELKSGIDSEQARLKHTEIGRFFDSLAEPHTSDDDDVK